VAEPRSIAERPPRPVSSGSVVSDRASRTRAIGRALGAAARPGTLLALSGPLGAGKTQLAKGVAEGLGVRSVVNSPTFVLMNEHEGRLRLFHADAYRLEDAAEAAEAGLFDERQAAGVTVVEWADRLRDWLPEDRLEIAIQPRSGTRRVLVWQAFGRQHAALVSEALR